MTMTNSTNNLASTIVKPAMLKLGIPKEIKVMEGRVSLLPCAVAEIIDKGGEVFIESNAGLLSGYDNRSYADAGAVICESAESLYREAKLIVKVKEPIAGDLQYLRKDHLLFCYLHLSANTDLLQQLNTIGLVAIAFETVEEAIDKQSRLPLLAPMSEIAGRVAVQSAAYWLHGDTINGTGGRGVLLGGATATERGNVTVLGAGTAGTFAIMEAAALGANVTVFDINPEALKRVRAIAPNITALYPGRKEINKVLENTDLLIGAVLIPGAAAPKLISRDMVRSMPKGAVIVDISIDQGGCIETMHATDYTKPTYIDEGVIHAGVTNLPGAVPRTASAALSAALLPYVFTLLKGQLEQCTALTKGINVANGSSVHAALI